MSISRINNNQTYINVYNKNKITKIEKGENIKTKDSIEISSLGKSLQDYSLNGELDNSQKVAELKNKIESGTYKVDARLTAKSLLSVMKEK